RRGALPRRIPPRRAPLAGGACARRGAAGRSRRRPRQAGQSSPQQAVASARMNLLLLRPEELAPDGTARLSGRRLLHAREVLRASAGDVLRVGVLGGQLGTAEVLSLSESELVLRAAIGEPPPERPGVD